jgi:Spy/CpxP family protein refolding chaperone
MNSRLLVKPGVFVVIMSFFFVSIPVYAENGDDYHAQRGYSRQKQEKFNKLIHQLDLSDEQVARLDTHKQAKMESRQRLYAKLAEHKQALRNELEKPESDNTRIKQIADSIKQVQSEIFDERIKGILEIKSILTPEQYSEFKEKISRYKHKSKDWAVDKGPFAGRRAKKY